MSDFNFYVSALATKKEGSVRAQASLKFLSRALTCLILVDNISISKSLRDIPGPCELQSQEQNKPQSGACPSSSTAHTAHIHAGKITSLAVNKTGHLPHTAAQYRQHIRYLTRGCISSSKHL
jgi:hypothetical protein